MSWPPPINEEEPDFSVHLPCVQEKSSKTFSKRKYTYVCALFTCSLDKDIRKYRTIILKKKKKEKENGKERERDSWSAISSDVSQQHHPKITTKTEIKKRNERRRRDVKNGRSVSISPLNISCFKLRCIYFHLSFISINW